MHTRTFLPFLVCWAIGGGQAASAADWPRFRGPNGAGISLDKQVPLQWSADSGILWKTPIPGVGNSSPVIWGNRVFVQSSSLDGKERRLLCLNAPDGKILWSEQVPGVRAPTHLKNSMASSTPATDGERVFSAFWDGRVVSLFAYDFQGKLLWKRELGGFTSQHGPGTSPMVAADKVIIANDQDGAAELIALEVRTGTIAWQVPRPAFRACYSTPFLLEKPGNQPQLIVVSTAGITCYNPQTGAEHWNWTWKFSGMALRTVASPIFSQGLIIASGGDGSGARHTVAVQVSAKGDVAKVWENNANRQFPYVPSMLAWGDHLYYVNDSGYASCRVAKTGANVWTERLGDYNVSASPILIDGKIYVLNEKGTAYVFPAAPTFKLLAKNALDEAVMATPAVADNRLFIRGKTHLYCIGKAPAK